MRIILLLLLGLVGCNSNQENLKGLIRDINMVDKLFLLTLAEDTNTSLSCEFDIVYNINNISTNQLYKIKKILIKYNIKDISIDNSKIYIDPKYFQLNQNQHMIIILSNRSREKILKEDNFIDLIKVEDNSFIGIYPDSI